MKTLKLFFVLSSFLIISVSQARTFEVLRSTDDGLPLLVDHYTATGVDRMTGLKENSDICEQANRGRLPTIRELAELSQKRGAEGILEVVDRLQFDTLPISYLKVSALNIDGQTDNFYFSNSGYQPDDSLRRYFWSSSTEARFPHLAPLFNGHSGDIGQGRRWDRSHVLCLDH